MAQQNEAQRQSHAPPANVSQQAARYIYCIVRGGEEVSLGAIGSGGREVYTVVYNGLCALVHDCPAQPYQSSDAEVAAAWALAHHRVVEAAWKRWGTVVPVTFNTIIAAGEKSGEENLLAWIETEYQSLKGRLEALAGKAEYGVQVFWDAALVGRRVAQASPQIRKLEEEIGSRPRGVAYMYRQKLEAMLKKEMEARAAEESKELYYTLSRCVDNIRVEKVKKGEEGRPMLMNLSCLVSTERYPELEAAVDRISSREGYFVRLAGSLPPYSFC